ncbi:MAG: ABC transporter permease [Saprospiraceae bacterium]|nr:ABC transporter permease [Saprospiraceae bacterium]
MINFISRRLLYGIAVMTLVVLIITSIIYLAPVDPTRLTFGQRSDNATVQAKKRELGLGQPLYTQLLMYINDIAPLSIYEATNENATKYNWIKILPLSNKALVLKAPYLRESYQTGRKVTEILQDAIPQTAILALAAMLIATVLGILLGVVAALKPNSWFDTSAIVASVAGYSLPSYIVAMMLALVFGYWLSDWTGLNIQGSLFELDDFGDEQIVWRNLILPAIALGIRPVALITQLTRSTMLDILSMDYIRTAKAKGLDSRTVILKHALRNALNPVTTAVSGWFAGLLAGAFFVESVFTYNGLGQVTVTALLNFDIPVVLGCVLFTALVFVVMNILVDVLYAVLDPRIRLS